MAEFRGVVLESISDEASEVRSRTKAFDRSLSYAHSICPPEENLTWRS